MTKAILEAKSVSKRFGALTALDAVDVSIAAGEFYALLGPSGCGKTTLLRCFAGFERPDEGRILLDGEDITDVRPNRRPICMMFQSYALFPHMTVGGNVAYGLEMERLAQTEIDRRVSEVLEITGLSALKGRKPHQLSGGQRQRVALARALIKKPKVLLLDEPLSALDRGLREQMQVELKRSQKESGIAFVVVTHDQEEALGLADRVAVLDHGRIQQIGDPREIYERPANTFVARFVGENNLIPVAAGTSLEAARTNLGGVLRERSSGESFLQVRPERLRLDLSAANAAPGAFEANIVETVFHGSDVKVILEVAGQRLISRLSAADADRVKPAPGGRVICSAQPEHIQKVEANATSAPTSEKGKRPMSAQKTIAFFPEAAYGPALNSVGIAQAVQALGHKAVFLSDPGFVDVYREYGFEAHPVNLSEPMPPEQMAKFWEDFINGHIPNFRKSPYDQIDNYVKDCWTAIVDSAKWAQKDLPGVLDKIKPDVICVDNVILFPAIKQFGKPWVRIISCSENEIEDPAIPPHLSGCGESDAACHQRYRDRFNEVIKPIHDDFNAFLATTGEAAYPIGQFFEASPFMNLLLYPEPAKFKRLHPLAPSQFQYLEGCVRKEKPYEVPTFGSNNDKPLLYVSFGSLGAGDTDLLKRIIATVGKLPYRALVNVGGYKDQYSEVPANVIIEPWFPQPSVIPLVDAVIHHGGNNSFTECLYFGKPAIIMPYVWDGHDNATRVQETGHGFKMPRYDWTDADLAAKLDACINDPTLKAKLASTSAHMQAQNGPAKAAKILNTLLEKGRYDA
jgi:spermidine/putrescine ABC transporter ATP-binding subunit/MGT family glycosyltransferase